MVNFFALFIYGAITVGFVLFLLALSIFIGPKRHSEVKDDPFECGTVPTGSSSDRVHVGYYLVALTFVIFDLEIVFLLPWALAMEEGGWPMFFGALPFFALITAGLVYDWRKGVLDWAK